MVVKAAGVRAAAPCPDDRFWQAVLDRDASFDGRVYYGVSTTGVYCRPSCGAKRPNRANVAFYRSPDEAERAGFRPCKRCNPSGVSAQEAKAACVARACRAIETAETEPSLAELGAIANLSPHHFHRLFKSVTGVTPKAYASEHRRKRVRATLSGGSTVTGAIFDAGYNSTARFYAHANGTLGMTPSNYRAGGAHTALRYALSPCSLGLVLVAASEKGIAAILLGDDEPALVAELTDRFPKAALADGGRPFKGTLAAVVRLIEEPEVGLSLPLDIRGTAFQQRVWAALRVIPAGNTASYSDVAHTIGKPAAVRAVASACAANPAAVAVPCHRVVRGDGGLAGYRWGVERKRALLDREKKS